MVATVVQTFRYSEAEVLVGRTLEKAMKPMSLSIRVGGVIALLVLAGCQVAVRRESVYGRYTLNQARRADSLWVRPDGTWVHSVMRSGVLVRESGTWTWDGGDSGDEITFNHFTHWWREDLAPGDAVRTGFWTVQPARSWRGAVLLPLDDDLGLYYRQTAGETDSRQKRRPEKGI